MLAVFKPVYPLAHYHADPDFSHYTLLSPLKFFDSEFLSLSQR